MTRLPRTRPIWCVHHITAYPPATTWHDTEQAAINQWRHHGEDKAIWWQSTVVIENDSEREAA